MDQTPGIPNGDSRQPSPNYNIGKPLLKPSLLICAAIVPKSDGELASMAESFADLRPDGMLSTTENGSFLSWSSLAPWTRRTTGKHARTMRKGLGMHRRWPSSINSLTKRDGRCNKMTSLSESWALLRPTPNPQKSLVSPSLAPLPRNWQSWAFRKARQKGSANRWFSKTWKHTKA